MTRRSIPVEDSARRWTKDPEFSAAYDASEGEFALAAAMIRARAAEDVT